MSRCEAQNINANQVVAMTPPSLCVCVLRTMDLPKLIPVISEVAWLRPVKAWRGREGPLIYSMEGETSRGQRGRDDLPTKQGWLAHLLICGVRRGRERRQRPPIHLLGRKKTLVRSPEKLHVQPSVCSLRMKGWILTFSEKIMLSMTFLHVRKETNQGSGANSCNFITADNILVLFLY